jgi:putative transposase
LFSPAINWARITPFFDYPPEIRIVIYTTNAIESLNMGLRKITKTVARFRLTRPY